MKSLLFASIFILIGFQVVNAQTLNKKYVDWLSTVDNEVLYGNLMMPKTKLGGKVPLFIWFNGGQGNLDDSPLFPYLSAKGWYCLVIAGRHWNLDSAYGCTFVYSNAYFNSPNPEIGPGEQDVLDGVDWMIQNYPIDSDRVYVGGFSMGGRGAYMMGLKVPDKFAGIAPCAPGTDWFENDINVEDSTHDSYPCRIALADGIPGSGPFSNTVRSIQSARFLIENAYNIPVFHGHGTIDSLASNDTIYRPFMQGKHLLTDTTFDECHYCTSIYAKAPCTDPNLSFCFGHTPTFTELHNTFPLGYHFAWMTTKVGHEVDDKWLIGTTKTSDNNGVKNTKKKGNYLIGAIEFLEQYKRNNNPDTVFYKSYTDYNRKAYWMEMDIRYPWLNLPGAAFAIKDSANNSISANVVRIKNLVFDLNKMQLTLDKPLKIRLQKLDTSPFDPNLNDSAKTEFTSITVKLNSTVNSNNIMVYYQGSKVPSSVITISNNEITINSLEIKQYAQNLVITNSAITKTSLDDYSYTISNAKFTLFPNPTLGAHAININSEINFNGYTISFYNMLGEKVCENMIQNNTITISDGVLKGIYMYSITSEMLGNKWNGKILIN